MPTGIPKNPNGGKWAGHQPLSLEEKRSRARERAKKHSRENPLQGRSTKLMKTFGITHQDYLDLKGSDACFICKQECKTGRHLAIDHDHIRGHIRGLLCSNCNRGLGMFQDDFELLQRATNYLKNYSEILQEVEHAAV